MYVYAFTNTHICVCGHSIHLKRGLSLPKNDYCSISRAGKLLALLKVVLSLRKELTAMVASKEECQEGTFLLYTHLCMFNCSVIFSKNEKQKMHCQLQKSEVIISPIVLRPVSCATYIVYTFM